MPGAVPGGAQQLWLSVEGLAVGGYAGIADKAFFRMSSDHILRQTQAIDLTEATGVAETQMLFLSRPQWDAFYLDFFRHAVSTAPGQKEPPSTALVEEEAARLLREFSTLGERDRRRSFVAAGMQIPESPKRYGDSTVHPQ